MRYVHVKIQQAGRTASFLIDPVANPNHPNHPKHFLLGFELHHVVHLGPLCCNPLDNSYCSSPSWEGDFLIHPKNCWWWFIASCSARRLMVAISRFRARPPTVLVVWCCIRPCAGHPDGSKFPRSCPTSCPRSYPRSCAKPYPAASRRWSSNREFSRFRAGLFGLYQYWPGFNVGNTSFVCIMTTPKAEDETN